MRERESTEARTTSLTAYLRTAKHWLDRMREVVTAFKSGRANTGELLEVFEEELLPQVLRSYDWLCIVDEKECLSLRCAYVISGAILFHALLPPADFLRMLVMARDGARELNDPKRARIISSNMGVASRALLNLDAAALHFGESLQSARQLKDRRAIAFALGNLANVEVERLRSEGAIELLREAVILLRELREESAEALALSNLGVALINTNRLDEAEQALVDALNQARTLGRKVVESNALTNLGILHRRHGNYQDAVKYYRASLAIDRSLGDARGEATNLFNLAELLEAAGDLQGATDCARLALDLRTRGHLAGSDKVALKLAKLLSMLEERAHISPQD